MVPEGLSLNPSWATVQLGEVTSAKRGISYNGGDLANGPDEGLPFLNLKSFDKGGGYRDSGLKYYAGAYKEIHRLQLQDLIVANTDLTPGGDVIGSAAIPPVDQFDYPLLHSHHVTRLRLSKKVHRDFLYYTLQSPFYRRRMRGISSGTTVLGLDATAFSRTSIPVPALPEQKKIAAILSSVDEAIQATQAVIEQTRRVKEGLLQDLLTKGIGHARFKQTEIGEAPAGWRVLTLADCCTVQGGYAFPSLGFVEEGVQVIRMANVFDRRLDLTRSPVFWPSRDLRELDRYRLAPGDLILSMTGTAGKEDYGYVVSIPPGAPPLLLNQRLCKLEPKKGVHARFFMWQLSSRLFLDHVYRVAGGTKQANLSGKQILAARVLLPSLEEQQAIAARLDSTKEAEEAGKKQRRALTRVKAGLLQDLLTGKVRVSV